MTVATSTRVPALISYLVTLFASSPAIGLAVPPVAVYNGPATTDEGDKLILFVGLADPDSASAQPGASWQQSRADLGGRGRIETSSVRCAAEAWAGTDDIPTVQAAVFAIVDAAAEAVRSDTTRFGGNATLADPGVNSGELLQNNTQQGAVARVVFEIAFKSFT